MSLFGTSPLPLRGSPRRVLKDHSWLYMKAREGTMRVKVTNNLYLEGDLG